MPKGLKSLAHMLDEVPFAPVVATLFGLVAGILVIATPGWLFERTILALGLPPIISATASPLGQGAQLMAAILATSGTAGILWLLFGPVEALMKPSLPQSRGHRIEPFYEAPGDQVEPITLGFRPLLANTDLGTPFLPDDVFVQTRDELVLDTPVPETISAAPELQEAPFAPRTPEQTPVSGPFDYLASQDGRTGANGPVPPRDLNGHRDMNGGSQLLH